MATLDLRFLGPFEAALDGDPITIPSRRARALLAMLALSPSRCVTREGAAAMLWPDRDEAQARASLRQELSALRRRLGPGADAFLHAAQDRIEMPRDAPLQCDLWWSDEDVPTLRGNFLEDVELTSEPFEDWRRHQRSALAARVSALLDRHMTAAMADGQADRAAELAERALALDPLNESAVATRARLALAQGRAPDALALLRAHAERLEDALGAMPGAALQDLEAEIRVGGSPAVPAPTRAQPTEIFHRPIVLLLSFETLSRDAEDKLFAEGLADDLRTTLSYWRWFPVVGPEAVGWKTAREGDMRDLAASVDATYVVSGSMRRAGDRVRITATLTDAATGRALWSEAFDGTMHDIFAFQEEVSRAIVARLEPQLGHAEAQRIARARPTDPTAWQLVAQADEVERKGGEGYGTPESNAAQFPLLQEALRRDPDYARAYSRLARFHWRHFIMGWSQDRAGTIAASADMSARALDLDPQDWEAHAYQALVQIFGLRDFEKSRFHALEAVRLNPSAAMARHGAGCVLEWLGEYEAALDHLEVIFKLNPRHTNRVAVLGDISTCQMFAGRLDDAVDSARQIMAIGPGYSRGLQRAAATFGRAGRMDLARQALDLLDAAQPDFSEAYLRDTYPFVRSEDLEAFIDALRAAGWQAD